MYAVLLIALELFCGLTLFLPKEVLAYKVRCPVLSELNIRSKICSREYYHCLPLKNIQYNLFEEDCKLREWVANGHYPVLRGRYIDYESCPAKTYQPVIYWSNEQHSCIYQKSICSGEGLVEFDNGNTTTDSSCRCDHTRGYAFVVRPKHDCFCIPSEEDCSCFIKFCSKEKYKLNADYKCVPLTSANDDEECPPIKRTDLSAIVSTTSSHIMVTRKTGIYSVIDDRSLIGMLGAASIVVAIVFWICVKTKKIADTNAENSQTGHSTEKVVSQSLETKKIADTNAENSQTGNSAEKAFSQSLETKKIADNNAENSQTGNSAEKAVSQSLAETKKIADTNAENSQTGHVAFKEQSSHSSELEHRKCQASQRKSELKADDYGLRPGKERDKSAVTEKGPIPRIRFDVELSNIIILHLDEKEGASAFKSHLEKLLKDISPTVKCYVEIFKQTNMNAVVNLEDVLNNCSILFFYISNNFVFPKVRRFGFDEEKFLFALTEDAKENYLNLKTVIDCEEWHVHPKTIRKDFKYLKLKTYDDQIKEDLIKLINDIQK